jgi:hypothetical protein
MLRIVLPESNHGRRCAPTIVPAAGRAGPSTKETPMERSSTTPDAFLEGLSEPARSEMRTLDAVLSDAFAGEERVLWEGPMWGGTHQRIIGYGAMVQRQRTGDVEWFAVGLAAQKAHLSVYVNAAEDGEYLAKRYASRLGKVRAGSANLTFRRIADVDLGVLREMARKARQLTIA